MSYAVQLRWSARGRVNAMTRVASPVLLPAGFCFLVSRSSGRPAQPAFDFVASTYLSGVRTRALIVAQHTVKAVVDDLADFHHFLDANNLLVADVDDVALENYINSLTTVSSPVTGKPYANGTVVRRRSSVARFLHYCQNHGLLKHRFQVETIITPKGEVERFAPNLPGPKADPIDKLIRAIDPRLLEPFLEELGPALIEPDADGIQVCAHPSRQRLMAEVCLHTGLRRAEVCDLQLSTTIRSSLAGRDPFTAMAIEVNGKGGKPRQVPFPVWLLLAIDQYVRQRREPAVRAALGSGDVKADHPFLFVMDVPRKGARGHRITPKMFNKEFADARERFLHRLSSGKGDQSHLQLARYSRITVHALRHAYALITFISRRDQGDPCPAKYVQSVLGHAYQDTTEKIYLRSSHVYESEIAQTIERLLENYQRVT
jgi:integrase